MIEQIKEFRIKIDGLSQLVKNLNSPTIMIDLQKVNHDIDTEKILTMLKNSPLTLVDAIKTINVYPQKEIEKCYDNLILAKAWLGVCIQELGESTPYANDGKRKTVEDIEPAADTDKKVKFPYNHHLNKNLEVKDRGKELNHIEKVDWIREEINQIIYHFQGAMINWSEFNSVLEFKLSQGKITSLGDFVYQHLCEARFWLGFELQRIKESQNDSQAIN
ncbi:MAG TPA: hypothetical protein PKD00_00030 [Burkholderiales bacterium]|nr:hypothetical protein [Burkholderiales bacterium]